MIGKLYCIPGLGYSNKRKQDFATGKINTAAAHILPLNSLFICITVNTFLVRTTSIL